MDKFELWEKIEDWFDKQTLNEWVHSYATFDEEGKLIHIQSSGRDYCQGAHYLQSGHYSWSGKTKLEWGYDEKAKRGFVRFPNGRIAKRWAGYIAVILFKTEYCYDHKRERWKHVWDGSPPQLLFKRERASRTRYEKGKRFFSHSPFVLESEAKRINVPENFYQVSKIYFNALIKHVKELQKKL